MWVQTPAMVRPGIDLLRATRTAHNSDRASGSSNRCAQIIESINDTLKGQLGLERHGAARFKRIARMTRRRAQPMSGR